MRVTFVLLVAAVALSGLPGVAAANDAGSAIPSHSPVETPDDPRTPVAGDRGTAPPWPGDGENNTTAVPPGQQLAGAVGAQGASVGSELWNRTLADRLDDADTPGERAAVLADEAESIAAYLDALAGVRANLTGAWANGTISESEYRTSLSAFVVRARAAERRANRTARAVDDLPDATRERYDVDVTSVEDLAERARDLYRFEGAVAGGVVDETLSNRTAVRDAFGNATWDNGTKNAA